MSKSKEDFKAAADHVGIQGADRLALWAWWLKAWKCATDVDEAKERELFEKDFELPDGIFFSKADNRYKSMNGRIYEAGQASDANLQLEGWLACAKSRAEQ